MAPSTSNRLLHESSLYLRQHAANPVDWYPWGGEALEKAKNDNRPILLSIGYAACHWCHVMAHESFENNETAMLMNRLFINIKVDRKLRPDLDRIYQMAHQLLSHSNGGWPLTIFMTPDQVPFYSGTYFPDSARHGLPAFGSVLQKVADYYISHQQELVQQKGEIQKIFNQIEGDNRPETGSAMFDISQALQEAEKEYDPQNGGFGGAPKFPQAPLLNWLLGQSLRNSWDREERSRALHMFEYTLHQISFSGLYDHIGGGFFRYCVDGEWQIPHFEKMLYDNAQLLSLYGKAYAVFGHDWLLRVMEQTLGWLARDMAHPEGGWYASLDADSPEGEGRYYTWAREEIRQRSSSSEFEQASRLFNIMDTPNFEAQWHLQIHPTRIHEISHDPLASEEARNLMDQLQSWRTERTLPTRDDKILTAWNALTISGIAQASRYAHMPEWLQPANQALDFIYEHLWLNGRLMRCFYQNKASGIAFLDDYAYLLQALLIMIQLQWSSRDFHWAKQLAEAMISHYWDESASVFYMTADDHESLLHRPRVLADEAIPSPYATAVKSLLGWSVLHHHQDWKRIGEKALRSHEAVIQRSYMGHASLIDAMQWAQNPPEMIVLRGESGDLRSWKALLDSTFNPDLLTLAIEGNEVDMPAAIADFSYSGKPVAYHCHFGYCEAPIESLETLQTHLESSGIIT